MCSFFNTDTKLHHVFAAIFKVTTVSFACRPIFILHEISFSLPKMFLKLIGIVVWCYCTVDV